MSGHQFSTFLSRYTSLPPDRTTLAPPGNSATRPLFTLKAKPLGVDPLGPGQKRADQKWRRREQQRLVVDVLAARAALAFGGERSHRLHSAQSVRPAAADEVHQEGLSLVVYRVAGRHAERV